jgi:hypothetical protein
LYIQSPNALLRARFPSTLCPETKPPASSIYTLKFLFTLSFSILLEGLWSSVANTIPLLTKSCLLSPTLQMMNSKELFLNERLMKEQVQVAPESSFMQ